MELRIMATTTLSEQEYRELALNDYKTK
jgi:hypothetical protein